MDLVASSRPGRDNSSGSRRGRFVNGKSPVSTCCSSRRIEGRFLGGSRFSATSAAGRRSGAGASAGGRNRRSTGSGDNPVRRRVSGESARSGLARRRGRVLMAVRGVAAFPTSTGRRERVPERAPRLSRDTGCGRVRLRSGSSSRCVFSRSLVYEWGRDRGTRPGSRAEARRGR